MNRELQTRDRGQARTQNFQRSQSSPSFSGGGRGGRRQPREDRIWRNWGRGLTLLPLFPTQRAPAVQEPPGASGRNPASSVARVARFALAMRL